MNDSENTYADLPDNAKIAALARGLWIAQQKWDAVDGAGLEQVARGLRLSYRWDDALRRLYAAIAQEGVAHFHPEELEEDEREYLQREIPGDVQGEGGVPGSAERV